MVYGPDRSRSPDVSHASPVPGDPASMWSVQRDNEVFLQEGPK